MNKKLGLFGKIFRFIDRKIVVPVTRFLMKIVRWFSNSNKTLETWLSRSNTLLFISLFLAVLIFIVIDQKMTLFTNTSAEVLKDREINAIYNEEAYVIEGLPDKVDVTLMGSRSDLFIAKQSAAKVTVDLTGLKPGTHKVNIEYAAPTGSIDYSVNPSVANVNIYRKVSESKTVTADLLNQDSLDPKLVIEDVSPSVDTVVVKGTDDENAINSLKKVATIKALVDVQSLTLNDAGTINVKNIPLKAYDKDGNILNVEIVPEKISVDLEISSPSKVVPIRVVPKGELENGKAISSIQIGNNASNVVVYGKQSVLDNLQNVPVTIDVDKLGSDKVYKLELKKPKGVKSMSLSNITVSVSLGEASYRDIDNVNIDVRNLNEKYAVQGISEDDTKVSVSVKGVDSVIKALTSEDIKAYIDLKNYKPGEVYDVPVKVEGTDSRVQYVSKKTKVKIKVVEK
ncbi:MAG: hypothetical protein IKG27_02475 [Bacilli bacterium]|nr:hypothetical protein [Bacilli bacterium]